MASQYMLKENETAVAYSKMDNATVKNLWRGFTLTMSDLTVTPCEDFIFRIGTTPVPSLPAGKEYALTADENGMAVAGRDYNCLMRGFGVLLMQIEYQNKQLLIRPTQIQSDYTLDKRMLHLCVFPENDLYFIKKCIRLAALCQYTHIVIEFWGMLQYDCLKELAWPHAFTKAQAGELIDECRQLGMEPIPMFNMFGHATASRVRYGKHVVLDQNPRLQHLFTPDGWAWDVTSQEVYALLADIRRELYDLFGDTEYFHIGCDEAYYYMRCDELRRQVPDYLHRLTTDVVKEGRKPMLWMDMILEKEAYPAEYYAFAKTGEGQGLLDALAKESVMVDWQYNVKQAPVLSSVYLKDKGHDLIVAPWLTTANYTACVDTVIGHNLSGIMLTTWHTLKDQMSGILGCAKKCGARTFVWSVDRNNEETATLLRRVSFEGNTYEDAGWSKKQIEI